MDVTCAEAKEFRNTESSDIRKLQWVRRKRMSWQPAGVVRGAEMFVMFALLLEPRSPTAVDLFLPQASLHEEKHRTKEHGRWRARTTIPTSINNARS